MYSKESISTELERAGIIQFFETTFELAWKVLKDYLEAEGYVAKSPRDSIKQAFQAEIIEDGHL
ncbi:nucleotidyltransferase substrate binding protein [Aquibacillus sediminis]|uniref:nucleotidyltransferase substrate binding protein n=1 Tax=Aquibacillus sediminis TaxID=2574734 RepID=UPI00319E9845